MSSALRYKYDNLAWPCTPFTFDIWLVNMGKRKLVASDPCQSKIQKLSMFGFFCNSGSEHSTPPARASNSVKIVKPSTPNRKFNNLSFYHLEISVGL